MDMQMPIMDGYEATKQIRATPKGHNVVIVAITAHAFEENREIVLSVGCDDFVSKPFREEVLFAKIAHYLGVRYVYEQERESRNVPNPELKSSDLAVMPPEWLAQLHQAAKNLNDELILQLIEQIPESNATLAHALRDVVNNFRLDKVIDLTQRITQ
ncbi:MAG: hypothetical protein NVS2B14_17160 [Chamaesiphon sp.]